MPSANVLKSSGSLAAASPASIAGGAQNDFPWYALRHWHGMKFGRLVSLLARHKWRIDGWPMAASALGISTLNSANAAAQRAIYNRRIEKIEIRQPVFILGHWRSGTTMLHELLGLDPQFRTPTTLETACPEHFLLTEWFVKRFLACPSKRPMDEMAAGWERPQECEFALMGMGVPSMYTQLGFPNDEPRALETLNFAGSSAQDVAEWGRALRRFFQSLLLRRPGRLLLKSPTHTGRIRQLLKLFPEAKFVHIARNPRQFVPSTIHLWNQLGRNYTFQQRTSSTSLAFVMDCFERMYHGYFDALDQLPANRLIEIRYEDLVAEPMPTLESIYDGLGIAGFTRYEPLLQAELSERREYRPNLFELSPRMLDEIESRCGAYCERFAY